MAEKNARAGRNRTLFLTPQQEETYLSRCVTQKDALSGASIGDSVIFGDCFAVLPALPDKFVDLLIADPPYNLEKSYGERKFGKMGDTDYEAFTRKWIEALLHTLKDSASVYICCDWRSSLIIGNVLGDYFTVRNRITWQREKGRGAKSNWKNSMEDVWFATVSNKYTFNVEAVKQRRKVLAPYRADGKPKDWQETENGNFRNTYPGNFWDDISIPYWSMPENTDHPTQKPEKLFAKFVLAGSNPGDMILDPFAGAGTSCVVAKKLGRRFAGIEQEREYCALAQKRLETAETDVSIQGYSGGVFWERNSLSAQMKEAKHAVKEPLKNASAEQESLFE